MIFKKVEQDSIPLIRYNHCYAKTYQKDDAIHLGYNVFEHSSIVASIARELISRCNDSIRPLISQYAELPALLHDIGKISPTFQKKLQANLPDLIGVNLDENVWGGHSNVSALAVNALYAYENKILPYIVGKHHERLLSLKQTENSECFGGEEWQKERVRCMHDLIKSFYGLDVLPKFEIENSLIYLINYILGLTIIADWIGSGSYFEIPSPLWEENVRNAVDNVGFGKVDIISDLSFEEIFGFRENTIQYEFSSLASGTRLYILEAPMGIGKTEAALYVAYKMLETSKASGIYFALPTQLTSEKIHERMQSFLEKILPKSEKNNKIINLLTHGKSWLKHYGLYAYSEDEKLDYSWFASKKRALLAPFGVGTIDQALMSVINVKHASVRTFGLAGKVVILDEIHSYDTYTGTLINELIASLLALNCTVIILSATLTKERRISLFPKEVSMQIQSEAYPLITAFLKEKQIVIEKEVALPSDSSRLVKVNKTSHDNDALDKALEAAEMGSQVLWIENTVAEAQDLYKKVIALSQGMDIEIGLLHSRFTQVDRSKIEDIWIDLYGKNSKTRYKKGRILIGTQVLEQSIDIDADILFTRFCPSDMLVQRLGRLHRHSLTQRLPHVQCEVYILMPKEEELSTYGVECFGKSKNVYDPYVLLRSYDVWKGLEEIMLPNSIRPLLEKTYAEREEEGLFAFAKNELERKIGKLKMQALRSLTQGTDVVPDEQSKTRISEYEQKEILLLKKCHQNKEEIVALPYSGEVCAIAPNLSKEESRKISVELMQSTVKVPAYVFPDQKNSVFKKLANITGGIADCALVNEDSSLDIHIEKYQLFYTSKIGLLIKEMK